MVPINRRKVSLYEEAKNGVISLVWQTATVFVCFIVVLLLTVGNPSSFAINITFISGIAFVAWREQSRVTKLRKDSNGSLDAINKRVRPQKRNRDLRVVQVNGAGDSMVIGSYLDKRNNNFSIDIAKSIASNQSRYKNYIAVPAKIFTDKNFTGRTFEFSVAQSSDLGLIGAPTIDSNSELYLNNPAILTPNAGLQKYQSAIDLVSRQNLRDIYGTIRRECKSVTILREYSQTVLDWRKPWFGRMTLEHDGIRTIVERFDMFGKKVSLFTTYDLVTFRIE